jgi:hypothetical protein
MCDLLRERYGEEFTRIKLENAEGVGSVVYTMTGITSKDWDETTSYYYSREHIFTANWWPTLDRPLRDNFLSLKMAPPFKAAAQARVDALFPANTARILLDDVWAPDDLPADVGQADFRAWARRRGGLIIDILVPVDPGSTPADTAARVDGLIAAAADLGVARVDVVLRVYSPENYQAAVDIITGGEIIDVFGYAYSTVAAETKARHSWPAE